MNENVVAPAAELDWDARNHAYLESHLARLRVLLRKRVLWLRECWRREGLHDYRGLVITDPEADRLLRGDQDELARFYESDSEARAISRQVLEADTLIAAGRANSAPPALDVIVARFGLTAFERDVLVLCVAPEIDPSFARLFAYVQDTADMSYPTPQLALQLFGDATRSAMKSFLPGSALLRHPLVELTPRNDGIGPRAQQALMLDPRIAGFLVGTNRADERVAPLLHPLPPSVVPPSLVPIIERAMQEVRSMARGTIVDLVGDDEGAVRVVAAALGRDMGLRACEIDVTSLPQAGPDLTRLLRLIERECVLLRCGPFIDGRHAPATLDHIVESLGVFLVLHTEGAWSGGRSCLNVAVPRLDAGDRVWLLRQELGPRAPVADAELAPLAQQFEFGPESIRRTVSVARSAVRLGSTHERQPTAAELWQACKKTGSRGLDGLGVHIEGRRGWDEIVLPEDAIGQLHEIVAQVSRRGQVYDEWGFGDRLTRGRGITALFVGPSGTGKTMAAEIVATELKLDIYRADLAGLVSKYIGETEKNLQRVFAAAEEAGWILFFDEADALFGKRTEVKDSHDRYANIEVNYLLQRMEHYRGLAILATNRRSSLDRAFLRRIRFVVEFPFPDVESRLRIWLKSFPPRTPVGALDFDRLARLELPGGNISNIATNAAFLAAAESGEVEMSHIMTAARREYAKLDRLVPESHLALGAEGA